MSTPIIITFPKYTTSIPTIRSCTRSENHLENMTKGRKRRLDHLTWEEKMQRKKLKNRVAAQTSRDRKRVKMEEMEVTVKKLCEKNESLIKECRKLREINKKLKNENAELTNKVVSCHGCHFVQNRIVDCNLSEGPAVSTDPLPQGQRMQSATVLNRRQTTLILMKILIAYLLYQTSSQTSTQNLILTNLKSSLKAYYKISPQIWKQLLQNQRLRQIIVAKQARQKWWGRHQSNWNPFEITA